MKWTQEMVSKFWDWQSQYPETYFTYQFGDAIAHCMRKYLRGRNSILDYGCGVGYLLKHLCQYGDQIYGTDISPESVAKVNSLMEGVSGFSGAFIVEDLLKENKMFDAVVIVEIIEHLYDEQLDNMLTEILGFLNPGGIAIFTTPNDEDLDASIIYSPSTGEVFHRWQHVRSWNRDSLSKRLECSGYEVIDVVETNMSNQIPNTLFKRMKWLVKQILVTYPKKPHLLCVAVKA
jgi:2-polyprenyl-3-methyl-5-hydroxy-6-metoxy-1,4-benzoquinol methylase